MVGYDDIHSQCFKDTVTAYQKVRQDGQLHIPAFIAALEAYKRHEGDAEDASRQVQEYIAFAASLDPKKYWSGVYNERWITIGDPTQGIRRMNTKAGTIFLPVYATSLFFPYIPKYLLTQIGCNSII